MINHYHVLGLSEAATPDEIRMAFKRLAVKYHPDKHQGNPEMEEKFKEVNTAYQILSDEYEKARFDLRLKYQQFSAYQQQRPYHYPNPSRGAPFPPRGRPRYRRTYAKVDYKQNAIATAYAFGITFGIALIVMSIVWAKESYDARQLEKLLAERRSNYELAQDYFKSGRYEPAFEIMSEMQFFRSSEDDMRLFKENMIDQMISRGDNNLAQRKYDGAIALYEMVLELDVGRRRNEIKENLANAYVAAGDPNKAISILKDFLVDEYNTITSLVRIAEIQNLLLSQPQAALENLLIAHRLAIKRYKAFYGEGYSLVIDEEYVPKSHYYLYKNLANQYLLLGDHEMAVKAADWNKYVWPDSTDAFVTTAEAMIAAGRNAKACREYSLAKTRGWQGERLIPCQ